MTTLFYRLPRLTILAVIVALISGFFAILTLGRQEDPTLVERFGFVLTTLPGADAERIESTVTEPIERRLLELPEVSETESTSRANTSQISIEIDESLSAAEVDNAWTLIRQQVQLAQPDLPQGASTPFVRRVYVGAATMTVALAWEGEGEPGLAVMARLAEVLEDRFRGLNATEETEIMGLPEEEVRVIADPEALAAAGLSLNDAARLVAAADSKAPAGEVRGDRSNIGLEIGGEFDGVARIRSIPLVQSPDGSALRVGDVADVVKGIEDPPTKLAFSNGKRAVFVTAYISSNQRVDVWARNARAMVEDFATTVPSDISVTPIFDQSKYTESRLNGLAQNLVISAFLVFAVLFFVMGWRAAIVVGMALPLTVALVLTLFKFFNYPLHQMSVTGLVISLGLLIDNAIVVVDEYDQERLSGHSIVESIDRSLKKLFGPLFASTLTTALAFAPIAFMPGGAGEFIGMIGTSVVFSVVMSFIIAMTIIPALAGILDRPRQPGERHWFWRDGIKFDVVTDGYRWSIERVLRNPLLGILIGVVPVMTGFYLAGQLPSQFFPQTERDQFQVEITLNPQATIYEAEAMAQNVNTLLRDQYPDIEGVHFVVGEPGPRVYYNSFNNTEGVPGYASGFVQLRNNETTRVLVSDVQETLRQTFPEAQILATPFEQGPPTPAPIAFYLRGENLETLNELGNQARQILAQTPGVTFTSAQLQMGAPIVTLQADETATAMSGLRLTGLASDIRAELEGVPAGSILEGIEEIPVRVIAPADRRSEIADLRSKTIGNAGPGAGTPLSALGELTLEPETASIRRLDGRRVNQILAYTVPYALPNPINADFKQRLDEAGFELPIGYDWIEAGTASNGAEAMANLASLAVPLTLVMLGAVALVFNSFRLAFLVMGVGVMAMGMAFGGVWMFNLPLGFNAILGALGLLGIAINGTIVVLALLTGNEAARNDDIIAQREVVVGATRHIVATTLTTMGGFVPIILQGDVFWMPLATGIAGGVAGAAILALYFTPAVYRIMTMKPVSRLFRMVRGRGWQHPARVPAE
ncbi:MAG: efflux RND transporter permease subunit [Hyphomonadaceae bacterium]|nr:efflux RND transporter permease subunit [Hyphomonadaceae bacterium]